MTLLGLPVFWGWLGFGLLLIAAEVLAAPGTYLLFIGLAAIMMAVLTSAFTLTGTTELVVFGLLSLLCTGLGWKIYGARAPRDAASDLHDPMTSLIGKRLMLSSAIVDGFGQARFGDSVWRVSGPDLPAGASVKVASIDGTTLVVEPT
jgi:membrane protein implicated in regulation of membrane protease activity